MNSETEATPHILVVEDENHLAAGLKLNLELEGYRVALAATARQAESQLAAMPLCEVVILDVMLPDMNGFALCRKLREAGNLTPVIMLTARNSPTDRIMGLDVGADDYLAKPFELSELLARVRSLLRRRRWERQEPPGGIAIASFADVHVNFATHEVSVAGSPLKLTQLEMDLLRYFFDNPGRVLGREELLEKVWKLRNYPNTRTVDNFLLRLRKYFEPDPEKPTYFVSVRGAGYKFVMPPMTKP